MDRARGTGGGRIFSGCRALSVVDCRRSASRAQRGRSAAHDGAVFRLAGRSDRRPSAPPGPPASGGAPGAAQRSTRPLQTALRIRDGGAPPAPAPAATTGGRAMPARAERRAAGAFRGRGRARCDGPQRARSGWCLIRDGGRTERASPHSSRVGQRGRQGARCRARRAEQVELVAGAAGSRRSEARAARRRGRLRLQRPAPAGASARAARPSAPTRRCDALAPAPSSLEREQELVAGEVPQLEARQQAREQALEREQQRLLLRAAGYSRSAASMQRVTAGARAAAARSGRAPAPPAQGEAPRREARERSGRAQQVAQAVDTETRQTLGSASSGSSTSIGAAPGTPPLRRQRDADVAAAARARQAGAMRATLREDATTACAGKTQCRGACDQRGGEAASMACSAPMPPAPPHGGLAGIGARAARLELGRAASRTARRRAAPHAPPARAPATRPAARAPRTRCGPAELRPRCTAARGRRRRARDQRARGPEASATAKGSPASRGRARAPPRRGDRGAAGRRRAPVPALASRPRAAHAARDVRRRSGQHAEASACVPHQLRLDRDALEQAGRPSKWAARAASRAPARWRAGGRAAPRAPGSRCRWRRGRRGARRCQTLSGSGGLSQRNGRARSSAIREAAQLEQTRACARRRARVRRAHHSTRRARRRRLRGPGSRRVGGVDRAVPLARTGACASKRQRDAIEVRPDDAGPAISHSVRPGSRRR